MKTVFSIFTISPCSGRVEPAFWPGLKTDFDTREQAHAAIRERLEWDKTRNNAFPYLVLEVWCAL